MMHLWQELFLLLVPEGRKKYEHLRGDTGFIFVRHGHFAVFQFSTMSQRNLFLRLFLPERAHATPPQWHVVQLQGPQWRAFSRRARTLHPSLIPPFLLMPNYFTPYRKPYILISSSLACSSLFSSSSFLTAFLPLSVSVAGKEVGILSGLLS